MITTTLSSNKLAAPYRRGAGFTLVEVLIGSSLGAFILAGVLSTFLFLGRSGANIQNYNDMESQARKALEVFAEDTRQASSITWTDANTLTLTVNAAPVVYYYSSATKKFMRRDATSSKALVTGVTDFSFKAYTITGTQITAFSTAADLVRANQATKQLQISLAAARTTSTVVDATNTVLSARFILRNKIVTA